MTDTHEARIEAAARAMIQVGGDGFGVVVERDGMSILDAYTEYARAAVAAADAVVTEDAVGRAIMGRTATAGAKAVQRLYRGEEQS